MTINLMLRGSTEDYQRFGYTGKVPLDTFESALSVFIGQIEKYEYRGNWQAYAKNQTELWQAFYGSYDDLIKVSTIELTSGNETIKYFNLLGKEEKE